MQQGMKIEVNMVDGIVFTAKIAATDPVVLVVEMPSKLLRTIPWTSIRYVEFDRPEQPAIAVPPKKPLEVVQ